MKTPFNKGNEEGGGREFQEMAEKWQLLKGGLTL